MTDTRANVNIYNEKRCSNSWQTLIYLTLLLFALLRINSVIYQRPALTH